MTINRITFVIEDCAFEGVKRIGQKVAIDFEKVSGKLPVIYNYLVEEEGSNQIVFATIGQSQILEKYEEQKKIDLSVIKKQREVYCITKIENKLFVIGSDKRGTIYGMFTLSEYIGVSPLYYWGDLEPQVDPNKEILDDIIQISKEPSIKYRGFFINDEWPCFGTWTNQQFGGFNAKAYDHIFELLLRLKGNYLWPAMWSASFPLDGPGSENEELADLYGVIMGYSHHEPCLRASEIGRAHV